MPYKSLAQMRFFNANRAKLEAQGVDVAEWNAASKGQTAELPQHKATHPKTLRELGRHVPNAFTRR